MPPQSPLAPPRRIWAVLASALVAAGCAASDRDRWEAARARDLPGPARLDLYCRLYRETADPGVKEEIERAHAAAAADLLAARVGEASPAHGAPGPTLAVLHFTTADGRPSLEGAEWAERVAARLLDRGDVRLVERNHLAQVLAELKLDSSGLIGDSMQRLGRLSGASVIVMGTMGRQVSVKAVEVETGVVVAAESLDRPAYPYEGDARDQIWADLRRRHRENPFGFRVWTDRTAYRVGEFVTFTLWSDRDAHVALIALQQDGSLVQIFPNAESGGGAMAARTNLRVPPPGASYGLQAAPPAGAQRVFAVAATRPMKFLPEDREAVFASARGADAGLQTLRDIFLGMREEGAEWAESFVEYEIRP